MRQNVAWVYKEKVFHVTLPRMGMYIGDQIYEAKLNFTAGQTKTTTIIVVSCTMFPPMSCAVHCAAMYKTLGFDPIIDVSFDSYPYRFPHAGISSRFLIPIKLYLILEAM
ncbi:Uncharacterized protein Fot_30920 [Forsythia ovata]|uniref:Uncharacterized protein n=1 Tax=Forsythia ovata TaxID=205694 RepID=A0ABD1T3Z4_9LAMI